MSAMTNENLVRTMDQERAEYALRWVEGLMKSVPLEQQAEVRRHITSLPALIRINGLGQAMAFYRLKGLESGHGRIYSMVGKWLCNDACRGQVFTQHDDVLKAITLSDMHSYMAAQNEALALLEWVKKLAIAMLEKE